MRFVSGFDKSYYGVDLGPLFVAMKMVGRERDLTPIQAKVGQGDATFDMWTGPALVANGRDTDFAQLANRQELDKTPPPPPSSAPGSHKSHP